MSKILISKDKCKGCEFCIFVCPKGVLGLDKNINGRGVRPVVVINQDACSGCALCAIMCPEACIEIWK